LATMFAGLTCKADGKHDLVVGAVALTLGPDPQAAGMTSSPKPEIIRRIRQGSVRCHQFARSDLIPLQRGRRPLGPAGTSSGQNWPRSQLGKGEVAQ
jgi:hypothetical protein